MTESRVRMVAFFTKLGDVANDELSRCWLEDVGARFAGLQIAKTNVLRYEQCHIDQPALKALEALGHRPPQYDGFALLEAKSFDQLNEVFASTEWQTIVGPVESKIIDITKPIFFRCAKVVRLGRNYPGTAPTSPAFRQDFVRVIVFDEENLIQSSVVGNNGYEQMFPMEPSGHNHLDFIEANTFEDAISDIARYGNNLTVLPVRVATILENEL